MFSTHSIIPLFFIPSYDQRPVFNERFFFLLIITGIPVFSESFLILFRIIFLLSIRWDQVDNEPIPS
ncbi:hypothetical protein HOLDEFILI_04183 [Holdemania filiformis DSM 12042]|uniref:Uncharacterized protein n=1 Tax=Holdemania filiformis DSM 12042 TaxID=545696 RepID=B9YEA8_9FIRM|nr:hypothetical protein HOLDEFILI_04183 [Holdemania filiformis DSM 12042]